MPDNEGSAGVTVASATTYASVLAPERARAQPRPLGALDDYEGDGILRFLDRWGSEGDGRRKFRAPTAIAIDIGRNRVYVTDSVQNKVKVFTQSGNFIEQWGRRGKDNGELKAPSGVAIDPTNGQVLVADTLNNRIQRFSRHGKFLDKFGIFGVGPGEFRRPWGIDCDALGNICVAEQSGFRVQMFTGEGQHLLFIGSGVLNQPLDVAVHPTNSDLYVADGANFVIRRYEAGTSTLLATSPTTEGVTGSKFAAPYGLAHGTNGRIYITDAPNNRVKRMLDDLSSIDAVSTKNDNAPADVGDAGKKNGKFGFPIGIAVGTGGKVFVADSQNHQIQKYTG